MKFFDDLELLLIKVSLEVHAEHLEQEIRELCEEYGITPTIDFHLTVDGVDLDTFHKALEKGKGDSENELYNIIKTYKE